MGHSVIIVKFTPCYCSGTVCACTPCDADNQRILPVEREPIIPKLLSKPYVPPPWHGMKQPPRRPR